MLSLWRWDWFRMEEVKSYGSDIHQMSIHEFKRFLVNPKWRLSTLHQWITLRNSSRWKSIHINFENLFRSIHILKYTTQLISSPLGFLADSTELESVTTMLAISLTMQISGKSPWLQVSQTNAFWDVSVSSEDKQATPKQNSINQKGSGREERERMTRKTSTYTQRGFP